MDTRPLSQQELEGTLRFLSITNRFFGGENVFLSKLNRWHRGWPKTRPITFLDIGTGGGDIPLAIARWARKRGLRVLITGVELVPEIADRAKKKCAEFPEINILAKNAFDFAEKGLKFDYVTANLFLHHIYSTQRAEILRKLDSMAERGLILGDLHRSLSGWLAVWGLTRIMGNNITRHDGPLSVRRAFTPKDLNSMITESNLSYLRSSKEPWFRVGLSGEKLV